MSQNQHKGISCATNLARLGHAVATVLQGAVSGGLHGAAVAAAKAFLTEIIKAIFYLILFCVFIPFFLYLSVVHPNFQYPTVQNSTIQKMNVKAAYVGSLYDSFSNLTRQEADAIIARLSAGYDDVVVTKDSLATPTNIGLSPFPPSGTSRTWNALPKKASVNWSGRTSSTPIGWKPTTKTATRRRAIPSIGFT